MSGFISRVRRTRKIKYPANPAHGFNKFPEIEYISLMTTGTKLSDSSMAKSVTLTRAFYPMSNFLEFYIIFKSPRPTTW